MSTTSVTSGWKRFERAPRRFGVECADADLVGGEIVEQRAGDRRLADPALVCPDDNDCWLCHGRPPNQMAGSVRAFGRSVTEWGRDSHNPRRRDRASSAHQFTRRLLFPPMRGRKIAAEFGVDNSAVSSGGAAPTGPPREAGRGAAQVDRRPLRQERLVAARAAARRQRAPGPVGEPAVSVVRVLLGSRLRLAARRNRARIVAAGELDQRRDRGRRSTDGWRTDRRSPRADCRRTFPSPPRSRPSSPRPSILRSAVIMASGFLVSSTEPASARYSRLRDSAKRMTIDSSHATAISATAMRSRSPRRPPLRSPSLGRCRASGSRPGTSAGTPARRRTRSRRR